MAAYQLQLPLIITSHIQPVPTRDRLAALLDEDLDFHNRHSGYASHNFHSFPAKFPPQLPRKFIEALTRQADLVLDPMAGSGTTVVEAYLTGRQGVGFDIDPLAILISFVDYWFAPETIVFDLAYARPHRVKLLTKEESKSLSNRGQGVCQRGRTHTAC